MLRMLVIALLLLALAPALVRAEIPRHIADIIRAEAERVGLDPVLLLVIAELESGGNPAGCTGRYCGVFQLDRRTFRGDVFDAQENARAAADRIADRIAAFAADYGREPTWTEVYLAHQQGEAGLDAHLMRPDGIAWRNVRPLYGDDEARRRNFADGDAYARAAIWRNVPGRERRRFAGVDEVTSGEFVEIWRRRVEAKRIALSREDGRERPGAGRERSTVLARLCATPRHWWEVVAP